MLSGCRDEWFKAYEDQFNNDVTFSLFSIRPYIDFKLAYDFAFSDGHSIEITDKVAVENFLGTFCYNQIRKDFHRSAIVVQLPEERLYFGSTCLSKKRMRQKSLQEQKAAASFDDFLTVLEERVFKCSLQMLDRNSKRNLGIVLRTINQGVTAVGMKMFDMFLKVRNGSYDRANFGSKMHVANVMRAHPHYKGSTQIDIIFGNGKVQVSRREHFQVYQFDPESLIDLDESKAEKWSLLTLVSQSGSVSAPWKIHFSAFKDNTEKRRATTGLERSANFWAHSQPSQFQETFPNTSKIFESALTDVSSLSKRSSDAVLYKRSSYRSIPKHDHISNEKDRGESAERPRKACAKPLHKSFARFLPEYSPRVPACLIFKSPALNTPENPSSQRQRVKFSGNRSGREEGL